MRGRDVDGDPQESVPRRGLTASLHQHPVVDLGNRTASERRSRRLSAISLPPKMALPGPSDRACRGGFAERADPLTIPPKVNASERFAQNEARGRSAEHNQDTESEGRRRWYQRWRDEYRNRPAKVFGGIATLWPCGNLQNTQTPVTQPR